MTEKNQRAIAGFGDVHRKLADVELAVPDGCGGHSPHLLQSGNGSSPLLA
jgi:hypothetical protein